MKALSPEELLLRGQPVEAAQRACQILATEPTISARVSLVRSLVWRVFPLEAATEAESLPCDAEGVVGIGLARLANGEPGRGRALMVDRLPPDPSPLYLITLAELHRTTGDGAAAVATAGWAHTSVDAYEVRWRGFTGLTLGRALADAGDEERAEVILQEALKLFELECPNTVLVAECLDAAGSLARRLRDPARGALLHRQALAIWSATLGDRSGNAGACRYSLAQALHRMGDVPEALAMMQEAFLTTTRVLGSDHLDTWITRFELGRMEVDAGEMLEGFPRMERARSEVCRRLGAQHPVVRSMDRWL